MRSLLGRRKNKATFVIEPVPSAFPSVRGATIAAAYAGQRSAGDFYDVIRVNPCRILFGLLDVAGRRDQNIGILRAAQEVFRESGMKLLSPPEANESDAMTELCLELNRTIMETAGGVHSSPAFAGCYNEDLGIVCYFNSGHTPALVRHAKDISTLDATGLPLGLFSLATSEAKLIAMEPGSALALVSRGVVEAECGREEFGLARVEASLKVSALASADRICHSILDDVQRFVSSGALHDDTTALALVRNPVTEAAPTGPSGLAI
jgi:serine phosphatase RsbU (regulator of sigma subunit)